MNKTYHFLAGLPRSGNTLLSSILNQNPKIYSTPLSPLPQLMSHFENISKNLEPINRSVEHKLKTENFLLSFMDNYYKDVPNSVIVDREKSWGTPDNLNIIKKYVTLSPKIIFTVRDILEILASFIKMDAQFLKDRAHGSGLTMDYYRSEKDLICEDLMSTNGFIESSLLSLASAFYPENKGIFHIVEYKDLVRKPDETMYKLYDFLDMPYYKHDFNSIKKLEQNDVEELGVPKDLHHVRESISQSDTNIDILSDYIQNKYSNMEFWRDNSLMKVRGKDF
jgi:sulfotransferase